ncbi:MAG: hypothetical protein V9E83_07130 [Baekduia sp.]
MGTLLLIAMAGAGGFAVRRHAPWDIAIPAAVAALVLYAVVVALFSALSGIDMVGSREGATVAVMLWLGGAWWVAHRRPPATPGDPIPATPMSLLAFAPAAAAFVAALANAFSITIAERWVGLVKDTSEHAFMVLAIQDAGGLDYSDHGYPRGLHAAAAIAYSAAGQARTIDAQLEAVGALVWLALSVLLIIVSAVAFRITLPYGERPAALAGFSTGTLLLVANAFMAQFVISGGHSGILALALALLLPLAVLATPVGSRPGLLALAVALVAVEAHLWTACVAAAVPVAVLLFAQVVRDGGPAGRLARLRPALIIGVVAVPVSVLPVYAIASGTNGGVGGVGSVASVAGVPNPPGAATLALATLGAVGVVTWLRRPATTPLALTVAALLGMTAVLLVASGDPTDLRQWYPVKALWFAIVCVLPAGVATAGALGLRGSRELTRLAARFGDRNVSAAIVLWTALVLAGSLIAWPSLYRYTHQTLRATIPFVPVATPPVPVSAPSASADRGISVPFAALSRRRIDVGRRYATRFAPRLAVPISIGFHPILDGSATQISSQIMRLETRQVPNGGSALTTCTQVAQVRAAAGGTEAVVVTALRVNLVRSIMVREGCGEVPVVGSRWPSLYRDDDDIDSIATPRGQPR